MLIASLSLVEATLTSFVSNKVAICYKFIFHIWDVDPSLYRNNSAKYSRKMGKFV